MFSLTFVWKAVRRSVAGLAVATICAAPAIAEGDSAYTKLDLDKCELLNFSDEGGGSASFYCEGHRGVPLYVAEGDLRFTISVGDSGGGFVTPAPFNTLGDTIEWRYAPGGRELKAIIIRYHLADPSGAGRGTSELAVIAAPTGDRRSCYLAFVKASAKPSQNEAARAIADLADELQCISGWR